VQVRPVVRVHQLATCRRLANVLRITAKGCRIAALERSNVASVHRIVTKVLWSAANVRPFVPGGGDFT
jgi:hypothetical protein